MIFIIIIIFNNIRVQLKQLTFEIVRNEAMLLLVNKFVVRK